MLKKIILTISTSVLFSLSLYAQFTLSAEIRPRTEHRNGFKTPRQAGDQVAFFTEQRSRLNLNFIDSSFTFRLSLQDVRVWGEVNQIFKQEDGNTFLSESWVQYHFSPFWDVKLGRQIISYDNQRYLGGLEWAQQGRRHDALLFIYNEMSKGVRLDIGFAFNSDDDIPEPQNIQSPSASFYSGNNYKHMQYAWWNKKTDKLDISILAMNLGYQIDENTVSNRQTFGTYGKSKGSKLRFGWDLYLQTGKQGNSTVNAFLAGTNVTYKPKSIPLTLGIEFISGKDDTDDSSDIRHFRPDFGTNHAFNGLMDYFFVGPANGTVGVRDLYIKAKFPINKSSLSAHAHQFYTGSAQVDNTGNELSSRMGTEFDFVYALPIRKDINFNLGFSFLIASDTMKTLRNRTETFNTWGWAMITFKPTLWSGGN